MKIGILTFHCAANYGAVFQTYGLQEVLMKLGHEVYVVDYRPDYLLEPYLPFKFHYNTKRSLLSNIKDYIRQYLLVNPTRKKRLRLFDDFQQKQLRLCPISAISELDFIVFGSDQIWNTHITDGDYDDMFIGKTKIFEGKHLVAYAASAGYMEAVHNDEKLVRALLGFDALSVREDSLSRHLENALNAPVSVVLDPVLLAGKDIFYRVAKVPSLQKPYLLTFQLGGDSRVSQIGQQMAKEKGLIYREIRSSTESLNRDILTSLSPSEVLGYFKQADYIITSSFHGTALSVLFEKSFNVVSISVRIDERADMLLTGLGLSSRKIIEEQQINDSRIDYNSVNAILERRRANSLAFLKENLSII